MTQENQVTRRREINLDAARAERAEHKGEPPFIVLEGETYELPLELPTAFVEAVVEERLRDGLVILLGKDAVEAIEAVTSMSVEDWEVLADGIGEAYGVQGGLGNLPASTSHSSSISSR